MTIADHTADAARAIAGRVLHYRGEYVASATGLARLFAYEISGWEGTYTQAVRLAEAATAELASRYGIATTQRTGERIAVRLLVFTLGAA